MSIRKRRRESDFVGDRDYIVIVLAASHDFFNELPEDEADRMKLLESAWDDAEIQAEVYKFCKTRPTFFPPWGETQFGKKESNQ